MYYSLGQALFTVKLFKIHLQNLALYVKLVFFGSTGDEKNVPSERRKLGAMKGRTYLKGK